MFAAVALGCVGPLSVRVLPTPGDDAAAADVVEAADAVDAAVAADAVDAADVSPGVTQRSCVGAPTAPGCGMVEVSAATITMGSDAVPCPDPSEDNATCLGDARPAVRDVRVSRFFIDRDEVTVGRFRAFWSAGHPAPSGTAIYPGGVLSFTARVSTDEDLRGVTAGPVIDPNCNWNATDRDNHPMNCLDWATALAFCAWDTPGGRLPTEAEWELAARGTEARLYAWGSEAPNASRTCWGEPMLRSNTCPVGSAPDGNTPRTGIRDLSGNIEEWLADAYVPYSDTRCWSNGRRDPLCAVNADLRATRGGNWRTTPIWNLRPGSRRSLGSRFHIDMLGFRCARSP